MVDRLLCADAGSSRDDLGTVRTLILSNYGTGDVQFHSVVKDNDPNMFELCYYNYMVANDVKLLYKTESLLNKSGVITGFRLDMKRFSWGLTYSDDISDEDNEGIKQQKIKDLIKRLFWK